jgi:hypothetical protein
VRYKPDYLDKLLERKRPADGADLYPGVPLKIGVILVSYGEPCNTGLLQKAMDMGNMRRDRTPITRCVNVRTARNKVVPLFIQDNVANSCRRRFHGQRRDVLRASDVHHARQSGPADQ